MDFNVSDRTWPKLSALEWLVTNGLGGFASGSVAAAPTRRYHNLSISTSNPPTDRTAFVQRIEEEVWNEGGAPVELSACQYPGAIHPQGFKHLLRFERKPLPLWVYETPAGQVHKTIWMNHGHNTTIVEYTAVSKVPIYLRTTPLLVYRDYHALGKGDPEFNYHTEHLDNNTIKTYAKYGAQPLYISWRPGHWQRTGNWFLHAEYAQELERGFDCHEDAFGLGQVTVVLQPNETFYLIFTTEEEQTRIAPKEAKQRELERLDSFSISSNNILLNDLVRSSDQFVVWRQSTQSYTLIAGYPWFTDWGRDTMIALQGICLDTGRKDIAKSILSTFLQSISEGMVPNRFLDYGEAQEYNSVDAALWLVVVVYEYWKKFGDDAFVVANWDALVQIISWHEKGTRYKIHETPEGLLYAGEEGVQLTWMDAKVGQQVITPRIGCPVEINALWYNAICAMRDMQASRPGKAKRDWAAQAKRVKASFELYFWNASGGYLFDVVVPEKFADNSIRPNQVYALSLPFPLLGTDQQMGVLATVEKYLVTAYGLRTLNVGHPHFVEKYEGGPEERDSAYHQGTVWPFLLGDYLVAYIKAHGVTAETRAYVMRQIQPLIHHFYSEGCVEGVSEVFDGLAPHVGKGTVHQAWSIGALIQIVTLLGADVQAPKSAAKLSAGAKAKPIKEKKTVIKKS